MKPSWSIVVAVAALSCALPVAAQFRKPEHAIKHRQSAMALQGFYLGRMYAMTNNRIPFDAKTAAEDAEALVTLTKLPWIGFVEGTDKGDTGAKPEIWKDKSKFDNLARRMQDEVVKLNAVAKTGNPEQIKNAVNTVDKACTDCHDDFRKENK
jgi:cytochrome c556